MLANGATLGYKKKTGSPSTYTDLPGLKEIPEMGIEAEKVENSGLTDGHKMYELGVGDLPDMDAFHHIYTLDTLDVAVEDVIISGVQVTAETENTENADTLFYGEEGYVLKISGNPFIIKENAANFAEYLGKKLIGLIFRPLDASALPNPTVEAGDIAYISDGPSKSYSALVTNLSFDPDDNMSISCDAESPKKTESQRPTELEQTLAKMRKETENTLSNYDLIVQQMSQLAANTLGFHETKIIQDDRSVIVYRHDKPKLSESKIVYKSGIDGFFVTKNYTGKDSTTVWKAGFDSNGNAALNILSVIGIHWDWAYGGTLSLGGAGNGNGIMKVFDSNGVLISTQDINGYFLYDKNGLIKAIINKDSIRLFSTPLNPNAIEESSYKGIQLNGDGFCRIGGTYCFDDGELSMEISDAYDPFVSLSSEIDGNVDGNFDELLADVFWAANATIKGGTATLDSLALPILLGYIVWLLKNQKKDRDANSKGTMLLLRTQLIEYHAKYMQLGDIPSYAYQNFCEMYDAYHALGGNGMVTKMKQEIEELHIKRKGE